MRSFNWVLLDLLNFHKIHSLYDNWTTCLFPAIWLVNFFKILVSDWLKMTNRDKLNWQHLLLINWNLIYDTTKNSREILNFEKKLMLRLISRLKSDNLGTANNKSIFICSLLSQLFNYRRKIHYVTSFVLLKSLGM